MREEGVRIYSTLEVPNNYPIDNRREIKVGLESDIEHYKNILLLNSHLTPFL